MTGSVAEQLGGWWRRNSVSRRAAVALAALAVTCGLATVVALSGIGPLGPHPQNLLWVLVVDLAVLLVLGAVVARKVTWLWGRRRAGQAGAKLHARLVLLFGVLAAIPSILVAVFSVVFLNLGLESWFSTPVREAIEEAQQVALAYQEEHQQTIRADILAMALDLSREGRRLADDPVTFNRLVQTQARVRNLSEVVVFDGTGAVIARAGFLHILAAESGLLPEPEMERVRRGEIVVLTAEADDRVQAMVKLDAFVDTYLHVGRWVDPRVIAHTERTKGAATKYLELEAERGDLQLAFGALFAVVALLLLLAAVWFGLSFATTLSRPISRLIEATEAVRDGNLLVRVPVRHEDDELDVLSNAFNRMTAQLSAQRDELVETHRQVDDRRRFTEAVLGGVSAGVLGLDVEERVELANRGAVDLTGLSEAELLGRAVREVLPEFGAVLDELLRRPERVAEAQLRFIRNGHAQTLLVRAVGELAGQDIAGFVITIDDITELVAAQRKAAWADVARRIAHEIKNPLTPIQLSAERLKRRYLKEVVSDPEVFVQCTDTIIRQVGDIGRMVDEFSDFARMPAPQFKDEDLTRICREALFLQQQNRASGVSFHAELPQMPLFVRCDARQIGQAITNLLINAVQAIEGRTADEAGGALPKGEVGLALAVDAGTVVVSVTDNGRGLPAEQRDRLTEPYVTTKAKGTGLGLAIVKKIMEDHNGSVSLADRPDGSGAIVSLTFPVAGGLATATPSNSTAGSTPDLPLLMTGSHGA